MKKLLVIFTILFAICHLQFAHADVPHLINYQGRLTDPQGTPREGSYSITFRIYDAEAGGNLLWSETHSNTLVQEGIFDVFLGGVTPLNLPFDRQYYLAVQVGSDPEMSPRQKFVSVGYAYKAESAEDADTVGGIEASTIPEAGKILSLDANAQFPASVTPSNIKVRGWVNFNGKVDPPDKRDSYNVASVTRLGTGRYKITWTTPFANDAYAVTVTTNTNQVYFYDNEIQPGSVSIRVTDSHGTADDCSIVCVIAIGSDQAGSSSMATTGYEEPDEGLGTYEEPEAPEFE